MLASLSIRNLLLIRKLDVDFCDGLNVFTGETGAGKSILLDALGLALGSRANAGLVSRDAELAEVTAAFRLGEHHPVRESVRSRGIPQDEDLILRRVILSGGRSTCFINDRRVTAEALSELASQLVEVHGQKDGHSQFTASGCRKFLDAYGRNSELVGAVDKAWRDWKSACAELESAMAEQTRLDRDQEYNRLSLEELLEAEPEHGENERLSSRRSLLRRFIDQQADLARAMEAIGPAGAEGQANNALRWLETANKHDEMLLEEAIQAVDRALLELSEAERCIAEYSGGLTDDPGEIERIEERMFALRRLARKHNVLPDDLANLIPVFQESLRKAAESRNETAILEKSVESARRTFHELANRLSKRRKEAAARLDKEVLGELAHLKLKVSRFETVVSTVKEGSNGIDSIVMFASANPKAPAGSIERVASGGEQSRFILALKSCLSARSGGLTMIFDEVDRGVGGATANAVGRRLRRLSCRSQVLVVTHSPQVAAYGERHWRIEKVLKEEGARTGCIRLDASDRKVEIARMLAGETITDQALAAADALVNEAT